MPASQYDTSYTVQAHLNLTAGKIAREWSVGLNGLRGQESDLERKFLGKGRGQGPMVWSAGLQVIWTFGVTCLYPPPPTA